MSFVKMILVIILIIPNKHLLKKTLNKNTLLGLADLIIKIFEDFSVNIVRDIVFISTPSYDRYSIGYFTG